MHAPRSLYCRANALALRLRTQPGQWNLERNLHCFARGRSFEGRFQWHPKHVTLIQYGKEFPSGIVLRSSSTNATEDIPKDNTIKVDISQLSNSGNVDEVTDQLRQLNHIRALVSQLYLALHVPDTYKNEMENMQRQLDQIQSELRPLEEKKVELLLRAERRSKILAWSGLGFMGMQFGFLARLTWWEYSWDIIEPITYFVTYGTAMCLYAYYLVTRQDYNFPAVADRWTALAFHKNVRRAKWEMNRYVDLRDKLRKVQNELEKMSMLAPHTPYKPPTSAADVIHSKEQENAA
ncbi:calcium uniporter protein, mitochondrial-like [Paramacrobiotus metropolitanus]|uniref:calcium uniporter protein, mitochondrial-like n=1 Tax=Paramacrobiotus metropolitanus TaxID=2943436 RepID=UPI002445A960|nr:calcium uniporter protein, mitochondrial-like [Paramacrobiotus metropolitanus]